MRTHLHSSTGVAAGQRMTEVDTPDTSFERPCGRNVDGIEPGVDVLLVLQPGFRSRDRPAELPEVGSGLEQWGAARPRRPTLVDYGMLGQLVGCAWSTRMAALSVPAGKK